MSELLKALKGELKEKKKSPAIKSPAAPRVALPSEKWDNIRFLSAFAYILSIKDYRIMKKAALKAAIAAKLLK